MRLYASLVVLSGCAFEPGSFTDPSGGGGMTEVDAGLTQTPPDAEPVARFCKFPASSLRLCIEFEDRAFSPLVTDAAPARLDALTTNILEARRGGTYAAALGLTSRIDVPESPMLDLTALTIEMWLWPAWAQAANLLVNSGQYYMRLASDGRVGCVLPTAQLWTSDVVESREWTHVACTFEGTTLRIYVDGDLANEVSVASSGLNGDGTQGTRLGGYAGAVDDIRIYGTALSPADVCRHAGRTECDSSPPGGG